MCDQTFPTSPNLFAAAGLGGEQEVCVVLQTGGVPGAVLPYGGFVPQAVHAIQDTDLW